MSDYPEAWVTAAAEALAEKTGARSHVRDQARAVLDAVAPTIRAEMLQTAQKTLAGEDTVEWARGAKASSMSYAQVIGILDDLIDDVLDREEAQ